MTTRLGIELIDGVNPIARFVVPDETAREPFCLGRKGHVILPFDGVLPVHAAFVFKGGRLWAASASEKYPARIGSRPLATEGWTEIEVPTMIRMGRIAVRPFLVHAPERAAPRPRVPAGSGPRSIATVIVRDRGADSRSTTPLTLATAARRFVEDWRRASTALKLAFASLPISAVVFLVGR